DLAQDHLLGKILRPDADHMRFRPARRQQENQPGDNFRSIHPSPPSASSAMQAAGTAPARICAVSTVATPRKMKTPNPPPPMAAAMVAVPIVVTVAMRTPAMIVGAASGSSTCHSNCH